MAVRKLKNGRIVIELQVGGARVFERLPRFATKADGQAREAIIRRDLWERSALGRKDEPSLAAAIELWLRATEPDRKDKLNPRRNAVHLRPFVEGRGLREVGQAAQAAITAWSGKSTPKKNGARQESKEDGLPTTLSPATVNRRLDVLRAAARWAWKQGLVTENLSGRVPRLREENARQVYLTPAQVRKLAESAPSETCKAAIMIAAYSGLRASELLSLTATPTRAASLTVNVSKTGKPRLVPVSSTCRPYLRALPLGISYRFLIGQFWEARRKAGMEHVHWHDLRHTTASLLVNAGVDLFTIGKILGHSSPATTARYSHLNDASLKKAMAKLL